MAVVLGRKPGGSGGGGGGTGTVTSVAAADGSVVVGGTPTVAPTVRTGTLDAIATAHPPVAAVALNAQKITGLANGASAQDAVAFGQLATAVAPYVPKSLYDANTVLAATTDDTPAAITMGASTILARLAAGNIKAASVGEIVTLLGVVTLAPATTATNTIQPTANSAVPLVVKGHATQAVSLQEWQNSGGSALVLINPSGFITGNGGAAFLGQNDPVTQVTAGDQFRRCLLLQAAASQSADIQQWSDSTPTILSRVNKAGYFMTRKVAAPADGDLASSELAIWLDATNGAGKVMFKAKTANGTVATGSVTLT